LHGHDRVGHASGHVDEREILELAVRAVETARELRRGSNSSVGLRRDLPEGCASASCTGASPNRAACRLLVEQAISPN
jgi:hypothetical protein